MTTLHGRLDSRDLASLFHRFSDLPFVSISDAQRAPLDWLNWCATVYHGIPEDLYSFHKSQGSYLAFIGRICPEKRLDRAIAIAIETGIPLKVAAKVDNVDRHYFVDVIEPLLDHPLVNFIGEIGEDEKNDFLGDALALLFPIDWPEPFGLVMIESLATGTPVIAYSNGSVLEIVKDGRTGFIVDNLTAAVRAVGEISTLSRRACGDSFEKRFVARRMAVEYVALYERFLSGSESPSSGELMLVRPAA